MANPFISQQAAPQDFEAEQRRIDYERRMAEQLMGDTEMPQGQIVGGQFVAPAWTQQLAKALNPLMARGRMDAVDERQQKLSEARMADTSQTLQAFHKLLQGTPAEVLPPDVFGPAAPAVPGNRDAAMGVLAQSKNPMIQQAYMAQALKGIEPVKPVVVGRTLIDPQTGKQVAVDSTWQAEQQAARDANKAELEMRLADQRTSREEAAALRRELAANASADRRMIAGMVDARREQKNIPKLPTSALKMQQEELDAIGTAGTINADLGAINQQIESGKLKLGPVNNLVAQGKNLIGASDESSRNLATFQSTLEKLRNDSLRLNKGVQTEGDAQRAWNEMLTNINDPALVKKRLAEIQKINERAAGLRKMNVDVIRSNFGVDPMDTSARENVPAAVGGGGSPVDALLKKYGG